MLELQQDDFLAKKKKFFKPDISSLRTSDIEGAQPYLPGYRYINKPNFYSVDDIEKASPQPRHRSLNKPSTNLTTSDIQNASPNALQFKTTRRDHNPLNPIYSLPTYEAKPSTPPRFVRDPINIDDIEGCKPSIYSKWPTRNTADISDIPGTKAKNKSVLNKPDLMNPKDINYLEVFTSNRVTNPLMPTYLCRNEDNEVITVGPVEGSSPKLSVKLSQNPHSRHLSTNDIEGATAGTKGNGPIGTKLRNYIRNPTETLDIEGAQAGSFKKGISTIRATNPLDPNYTWMTEDPADLPEKKPETVTNDRFYQKNLARFWGASSQVSRTASSTSSHLPTPKPEDLKRNAKKFFGHDSATPNTLQLEFNKNAEKFYENQGRALQNYLPGSIHRQKQNRKAVDENSESYQENAKRFYHPATPADVNDNESISANARLFFGVTPSSPGNRNQSQGSLASKHSSRSVDYKFTLARSEIAKPGDKDQRTTLTNAGKTLTSS